MTAAAGSPGRWALAVLFLALAASMWAGPARAVEPIRVAILGDARSVEVGGGPTKISDLAGQPVSADTPTWLRIVPRRGGVEVRGHGAAPAVRLLPVGPGTLRLNGREYPGALEIAPGGDGLVVINEVPLEEYVAGAVKAEAGDLMPAEMLKAQAIVARTYAAYHQRLNQGKLYDLVASNANQQYMGRVNPGAPSRMAVEETRGQVLLWEGRLFPAFYHTDSGGHTENPRAVFSAKDMPALQAVRVDFPSASPHHQWQLDMSLADVGALLQKGGISIGRVVGFDVLERSVSLRVAQIAVRGIAGSVVLRGNDLRRLLGYDTLKSTLFAVDVVGSIARFVGRGYGHGVGLDQATARTMAERGYSAAQIVAYYYPGARLGSLR